MSANVVCLRDAEISVEGEGATPVLASLTTIASSLVRLCDAIVGAGVLIGSTATSRPRQNSSMAIECGRQLPGGEQGFTEASSGALDLERADFAGERQRLVIVLVGLVVAALRSVYITQIC